MDVRLPYGAWPMQLRRLAPIASALVCSACSYTDWTESVLTTTSPEADQEAVLESVTARLAEALIPEGFTCDSHETMVERGHTEWYATCQIVDVGNYFQGTSTSVTVKVPADHGSARVQVHTGHVTFHPFTPSTRHFRRWAEFVEATLCGWGDFEVEHSWPADSDHPIECEPHAA